MTPERWREVEDIYQSAMDREPGLRAAYLVTTCKGNEVLRREVDSLLQCNDAPVIIDRPAWEVVPELLADSPELSVGTQLGPYRIEGLLGAGGMGRVYRARDTRLGRSVALKISNVEFIESFEREARVVASLNHPNICTLHDVGPNYLVMEVIEGPTLTDRIEEGPIPLEEALGIAGQIASALEAAHQAGIIHGDLKPGNIKIKQDGTVKVLDFGLAKLVEPSGPERTHENSPTRTLHQATHAGTIFGTAAYMSPEQARGKLIDKRGDIWAFGVVLYEMLTGRQLFQGETVSDTLAAVLTREPDLDRVPLTTRRLLRRCLEKDPTRRLRDIGDAMPLLEDAPQATVRPSHGAAWMWRAAAAFFLITTAAVSLFYFRERRPSPVELTRFQIPLPESVTLPPPTFAISPDGRRLVFFATGSDGIRRLWLRALDSLDARPLPGSEITRSGNRQVPFWSPDSRYVAFEAGGQLKKIDISGGPPQALCNVSGGVDGGSWNRDDVIIMAPGNAAAGLMRVSAAGGTVSSVTIPQAATERHTERQVFPTFLPDGKHFLYMRITGPEKRGIYVGSLDARPEQQDSRRLLATAGTYAPLYMPSPNSAEGHLLFVRDGTLLAAPFNPQLLKLTGEPEAVTEQTGRVGEGGFSVSNNGVLVYRKDVPGRQLKWFDRQGKVTVSLGPPGSNYVPGIALSPDGTRVALCENNREDPAPKIWVVDLATGSKTRLTFGTGVFMRPVWSPDAKDIAFSRQSGMYQKPSNGAADEKALVETNASPTDWSRDGHYLLYTSLNAQTKHDVWVLPRGGDHKPFKVLGTEFDETGAVFSPDQRWIAYVSDESGREEIYVTSFSLPSTGQPSLTGSKWMVSKDGGVQVRWRRDGELFYLTSDGTIVGVDVKTAPVFQAGVRRPLFRVPAQRFDWDVAADGKRFLVLASVAQTPLPPFNVLLNWTAALKKP